MIDENIGKWVTVVYFEGKDEQTAQGILSKDKNFLVVKGDFKTMMLRESEVKSIKISGGQK